MRFGKNMQRSGRSKRSSLKLHQLESVHSRAANRNTESQFLAGKQANAVASKFRCLVAHLGWPRQQTCQRPTSTLQRPDCKLTGRGARHGRTTPHPTRRVSKTQERFSIQTSTKKRITTLNWQATMPLELSRQSRTKRSEREQ